MRHGSGAYFLAIPILGKFEVRARACRACSLRRRSTGADESRKEGEGSECMPAARHRRVRSHSADELFEQNLVVNGGVGMEGPDHTH